MMNYQMLLILAIALFSSITMLIIVQIGHSFAQSTDSEEYKSRHDGGDRAEYEQELAYSDPPFYVPPVRDISNGNQDTANNNANSFNFNIDEQ
jgi:hypothetical protein